MEPVDEPLLTREKQRLQRVRYEPLLDDFADYLQMKGKAHLTVVTYCKRLRQFFRWMEDVGADLTNVTRVDVLDFRRRAVNANLSPSTVNGSIAAISCWLTYRVEAGQATANTAHGVVGLAEVENAPTMLDRNDVNALLRAAEKDGPRSLAIIWTLVGTGIRVGECAALEYADVALRDRSGTITIRNGKGGKLRVVPIPGEARKALADYFVERGRRGLMLWRGQRGALQAHGIYDLVARLSRSTNLKIHPHQLRHYFAGRVLANTHDIVKVQHLLGHASIRTTARYLKPTPEDLQRAVEGSFA